MAQAKPPKWRKVAISAAVGSVVGVLGAFAIVPFFKSGALTIAGRSEAIAAFLGLMYAVVALCIGIGLTNARVGARFLNLEDADELRDQRRVLAYSAAAMAALGVALIVLAFAGPGGIIAQPTALAIALPLFAGSVALTFLQLRHMDELVRSVSTEAGSLAYHLVLVVGGTWAMLAHLDFAQAPAPIDWLTMFFGLVLVASLIATARRGMLALR